MAQQVLSVGAHRRRFPLQKLGDGLTKARVSDPMGGMGERGQKAPVNLVLTLRPRLESLQALLMQ